MQACCNATCKWNKGGCTLFPGEGWSACRMKIVGKILKKTAGAVAGASADKGENKKGK